MNTDKPYEGMGGIIYARVSTDDKGQQTGTQVREMTRWCNLMGIAILGVYEEERSAKNLDRPMLQQVLGRLAIDDDVNLLIAWSESRLSRDTSDMEKIVSQVQKCHKHIRFVSSSACPDDPTGKLMTYIGTWQSSEERAKLCLNTKKGMETARLNGKHCGRFMSFCFIDRMAGNENRIMREGPHKTVLMSKTTLMEYASQGFSIPKTASFIGVSHETLRKALIEEDLITEFRETAQKARQGVAVSPITSSPTMIEGQSSI